MGALRIFKRISELLDTSFSGVANDDFLQRKSGSWTNRTVAQVKTDLGISGTVGTVTSVGASFTGGIVSVSGSPVTTSGTLALTVAGTSGGIPYFSSSSTWASSAALGSDEIIVGGGVGGAPVSRANATVSSAGVITVKGTESVGSHAITGSLYMESSSNGSGDSKLVLSANSAGSHSQNVRILVPNDGLSHVGVNFTTSGNSGVVFKQTTVSGHAYVAIRNAGSQAGTDASGETTLTQRGDVFEIQNYKTGGISLLPAALADATPGLKYTATINSTNTAATYASNWQVTSAGSSSFFQSALNVDLLAGYTGNAGSSASRMVNAAAGTGTGINMSGAGSTTANIGNNCAASATTTGSNVGVIGTAIGGNLSVGVLGKAVTAKNSATNIGVIGNGLNTGTSPIQIGGYFGLNSSEPTYASAALMADNGSTTSSIFVARDNGTAVFTVADGGAITASNGATLGGALTLNGTSSKHFTVSNGDWYSSAVPYVRPTQTNAAGILDVLANGTGVDSWVDIGTDFTTDNTNGEFIMVRKKSGSYGQLLVKGLGSGVGRSLVLQDTSFSGVAANGGSSKIGFNVDPTEQYHAKFDQNGRTTFVVENPNAGTGAYATIEARNGATSSDYIRIGAMGTGWTTNGAFFQDSGIVESGPNLSAGMSILTRAGDLRIYTGGFSASELRMTIASTGGITITSSLLSTSGTAGIGYATGAGGTVTQATSRTTGVTINKVCGSITLVSAAGSASWQSFTVTNSAVAATDQVDVCQKSGTDKYMCHVTAVGAGSFEITFATTGGTTTEQPVFTFFVSKAVTS